MARTLTGWEKDATTSQALRLAGPDLFMPVPTVALVPGRVPNLALATNPPIVRIHAAPGTMRSTRAGPSRARNTRKSASPYARAAAANGHSAEELSESDMEIDGDPSQTQGAGARSRPRHSLRAQVFEVPDAGEKARIGDGYRELQRDADGACVAGTAGGWSGGQRGCWAHGGAGRPG